VGIGFPFHNQSLHHTSRFFFRGFLLHMRTKAAKASPSHHRPSSTYSKYKLALVLAYLYRAVAKGFCAYLYKKIDHASLSSLQLRVLRVVDSHTSSVRWQTCYSRLLLPFLVDAEKLGGEGEGIIIVVRELVDGDYLRLYLLWCFVVSDILRAATPYSMMTEMSTHRW
jgi:hypothetical protein